MEAVILAAGRTPIGSFLRAFKDVSAVELGAAATQAAMQGFNGADIADVIVGNVPLGRVHGA